MRPTPLFLTASLALILAASPARAAEIFVGSFSGLNEVAPTPSAGTGSATVTYDSVAHTLRVQATFSGLTGTTIAAHIHASAPPGVNVGIATQTPSFAGFPLGVTSGSMDTTFDLTLVSSFNASYVTNNGGTPAGAEGALATALRGGLAYFNIHTQQFPGGEIRANLAPVPDGGSALGLLGATLAGLLVLARRRSRNHT